ncbi:SusC/RagA family TonB-linked outer membrane protein [Pontibacter sp. SGAir0037]|uniref:SusC/RagA family TonB-linked outer membrane protein n=1 Tax=Pontibacter sp. SGAir0037 TaxID=2571030 RepID=UPI0010CD33E4|nr:SusC/RagA family TonB-linked outer membrane protein [Pontibacter sp. SGAir0037]QCR22374.1 SusC/RagA family TonB-linked outer membrane protein [Pontibacter sp. SGAir0037]
MKYLYKRIVLGALITVLPAIVQAQTNDKINVKAIVRDSNGNPISGVVVKNELDIASNTVTDSLGTFSLSTSPNAILLIGAPGYRSASVLASSELSYITMMPDQSSRAVQVAHRKVKEGDLNGDVSVINVSELLEKNYMTSSLENMQALVNGFHGNIWGMDSYLVLVDGVPRDASSVMPTEIDQISFLKGVGAVALYGSRAAKGVVYITTKRGEVKDLQIRARVNSGVFVPKSYPNYLGSAEYMTLYNEARRNDGLDELYTDGTIYNHASGLNPYRYPNVDYFSSEYLRKSYNRHDGTVEISGGNKLARYYTNIGFNTAGSLLNFGEAIKNNRSDRLNVRGNVDVNITDYIYAKVDAAAIYSNGRGVNTNYWQSAATLRPHRFAPLIPISMLEANDEASWQMVNNTRNIIHEKYVLGGTQLDQTNPFAAIYAGGNSQNTNRQFQFNTAIGANLDNVIKGLAFESTFGVDYATSYTQSFNNDYAIFEATWNNYAGYDQISKLTQYGTDARSGNQNVSNSSFRQTLAFSGQLNYLNTINDSHTISAMLVANGFQQANSGVYHKNSNANLGIHVGYNFRNKYYADFNGAIVHSARLPEANRRAFSPTASLAWRISEEDFLRGSSVVDNLKLSVSAGRLYTDLSMSDYYMYTNMYTQTDGAWYSWRDGALNRTTDSRQGANANLTFSKRDEVNVSAEASLFKGLLTMEGAFFANEMTGNVVRASALYPSYFSTGWPNSSFIPYVNYNDDQRIGFDYNLNFNKNFRGVEWSLGFIASYYETKATKRAELFEDEYQKRQGRPIDAIWGLQSAGFFTDNEDIANSPKQSFGQVRPGDIKYIDQNGDKVINEQDEVYLGRGGWYGAPLTLGLNLTAKWKNFTFFALGLGRYGAHDMKSSSYFWIAGEDKYSEVVRDRWTEETKNTATYPRLTTLGRNNNFRNSDFWLYNSNRFDLAKVQISYDLPLTFLGKSFVRELGVYVNGLNLLTVSKERELMEMNVGSAPQTRFYNVGVKALF